MSGKQRDKHARKRAKQLTWAKAQGGWSRAIRPRSGCPTPKKRAFDTEEAAVRSANDRGGVYRCRCGKWHRTRQESS